MSKVCPTPYHVDSSPDKSNHIHIVDASGKAVADVHFWGSRQDALETAAFIAKACTCHENLVGAIRSLLTAYVWEHDGDASPRLPVTLGTAAIHQVDEYRAEKEY